MLVTFLPALVVVAYTLHATIRYRRAPNPYRFSVWLTGIFLMAGVLILLYVPPLTHLVPASLSPLVRLITHQLFNLCLMLSGYFVIAYCIDIMHGWNSPRSRQQRRQYLSYLLTTIAIMSILFFPCGP